MPNLKHSEILPYNRCTYFSIFSLNQFLFSVTLVWNQNELRAEETESKNWFSFHFFRKKKKSIAGNNEKTASLSQSFLVYNLLVFQTWEPLLRYQIVIPLSSSCSLPKNGEGSQDSQWKTWQPKVRTQHIAGSRLRITGETHEERNNNKTQELCLSLHNIT